MYALLVFLQTKEAETAQESREKKVKRSNAGGGSFVKKGAGSLKGKTIPNLVYQVEQYERHLIQFGKKAKLDLSQYVRVCASQVTNHVSSS